MPTPIPKAISLSSPKSKIVFEPDRKAIAKVFGEGYQSRLASNSECYPRVFAKAIHQIYPRILFVNCQGEAVSQAICHEYLAKAHCLPLVDEISAAHARLMPLALSEKDKSINEIYAPSPFL